VRAAAVAGWALVHVAGVAAAEADIKPPAAPAPAYVDKLIEGASPLPELVDDDAAGFDARGAPRALRIESRAQSSSNDQGSESSAWVSVRGALDTANYGAFSLDASARLLERTSQQRRGAGLSFSLYQTAMPFGGGWYASQGLGVIQTLGPRLAGQQASFFVPTRLVQGASTQWRNETSGVSVQLSGGETGSFSSIGQGAFYGSGNRVVALGFELQPARAGSPSLLPNGWRYAAAASTASGSAEQLVPGLGSRLGDVAGGGVLQALRWESANASVQGNMVVSRNQNLNASATQAATGARASHVGAWLDGAVQTGELTQRWGLHRLAPSLSWQGSAIGGNSEGGYYRWSLLGLRTQTEAQVSSLRPIDASAGGTRLNQAGVSVRHYIDQRLGVGGTVQLSDGTTTTLLVSGYGELRRPWADLRLQAGVETGGGRVVTQRLSSDQAWVLPIGQRLSTSQALTSTRAGTQDASGAVIGNDGKALELAVAGGTDVSERLALDLNARASLPLSSQAARVYNLSASSQWRVARGWSLGATLGASHTSGLTSPAAATPIPALPGTVTPFSYSATNSRDLWITLRYDFQAGSPSMPIGAGARAGSGGGSIEGVVFLDDNRNGRLDAIENRAVNVSVVLDGRYAVRTDAQGRFEFPFVAPGAHGLMVVSDTLPLPWVGPAADALRVEVTPREITRIEIGATRE
jgi:hypothetical protein